MHKKSKARSMRKRPAPSKKNGMSREDIVRLLWETVEDTRFMTESVTGEYWKSTPEERRAKIKAMSTYDIEYIFAEAMHEARQCGLL